MTYQYLVKTVGDCAADDRISVDANYTVGGLAGLVVGHQMGALNIEDQCWFGTLDSYPFAPKDAPALVAVPLS